MEPSDQTPLSAAPEPPAASTSGRLLSLDALRGFDMFWIMGADSLGPALAAIKGGPVLHAVAEQLDHVAWRGFHFEDLIFPMFVFIAGVSLVFSLGKIIPRHGKDAAFTRVLKRAVMLYVLGLFYYGGFSTPFSQIRLLGVLQRIAICYGVTGFLFIFFRPRTLVGIAVSVLLGYWALLALVPVPGLGVAGFEEGKNIVNWFDSRFLPLRKWDGDHDPEGVLSTLPAVVSCLLGVFAGIFLRDSKRTPSEKAVHLAGAGVALLVLGYSWGAFFPIIKKLWTSPFVLVAGGWSALLLATFYYLIDVKGWQRWCRPFVWVGLNSITVYLAGNLIDFEQLASRLVGGNMGALLDTVVAKGLGTLLVSLLSIGAVFGLARFLHHRRIYLRL